VGESSALAVRSRGAVLKAARPDKVRRRCTVCSISTPRLLFASTASAQRGPTASEPPQQLDSTSLSRSFVSLAFCFGSSLTFCWISTGAVLDAEVAHVGFHAWAGLLAELEGER